LQGEGLSWFPPAQLMRAGRGGCEPKTQYLLSSRSLAVLEALSGSTSCFWNHQVALQSGHLGRWHRFAGAASRRDAISAYVAQKSCFTGNVDIITLGKAEEKEHGRFTEGQYRRHVGGGRGYSCAASARRLPPRSAVSFGSGGFGPGRPRSSFPGPCHHGPMCLIYNIELTASKHDVEARGAVRPRPGTHLSRVSNATSSRVRSGCAARLFPSLTREQLHKAKRWT